MRYYNVWLVLMLGISLYACREDDPAVFNPNDETEFRSWDDVFESFWNGMNHSYAFWDIDPTDWDAVYDTCKPQFAGLEFGNRADSATVLTLFEAITANLIDHHYALRLYQPDGETDWVTIRPGNKEVTQRAYYHEPFTENALIQTTIANGVRGRISHLDAILIDRGTDTLSVFSYRLDKDIVYLRLNRCHLTQYVPIQPRVRDVLNNYYALIDNTPDLKGIIIDTRGNKGGHTTDLYFTLAPLIGDELTFAYTRSKNGMGRLDYTPWIPMTLSPVRDFSTLDESFEGLTGVTRDLSRVPIVALADVNSLSMGEITPMAISELPNGSVVGERTWGGHGPLSGDHNDYYAGQLKNKAFLLYSSTSMVRRLDGKSYEGYGIVPDVEALFDKDEFAKGNDTQLERAVQHIRPLAQ